MERNEMQNEQEGGRMERVREQAREVVESTRERMAAGASGVAERSREVASRAGETVDRARTIVQEAEPDEALRSKVSGTTESSVHRAGDRLHDAAPAIGRTAEKIADRAGAALHMAAGPLSRVLGAIAATLGGWWKKASEGDMMLLPAETEEACRTHFATLGGLPAGMTFDRARTGYTLGYMAGRNPEYTGRSFDEIEADLRTGFGAEETGNYDEMRDFARFGYSRAMV